jgi:PAS domain S-box-containing protein
MKILLVDDSQNDRKVLRYYITARGYEIIEAKNGEEGLAQAAAYLPDLIISDALMPVMDGFQFLRKLKQDKLLRSIPFIFYSSVYEGDLEKQLAASLGADAFLFKAKEPEEFWKDIEKIIIAKTNKENVIAAPPIEDNKTFFEDYSNIVASKLEEKVLELQKSLAEQKLAQKKILILNRIYSALSNISQTIVKIHDINELLAETCRITVEDGGFQMAWIGMVNEQTNKIGIAASNGVSADYLEELGNNINNEQLNNIPTETAIKTAMHRISNDIMHDDEMISWQNKANQYNIKSFATFPIIVSDNAVGTFNIYSNETGFFGEENIKLLDKIARSISFSLEFIKSESERTQAEEALRESEERYRCLVEKSPDAIIIHQQGKCVFTNSAGVKLMNAKNAREMLGKPILDFVHPAYRNKVIQRIKQTTEGETAPLIEEIFLKFDETAFDVEVSAIPFTYHGADATQVIFRDITRRKQMENDLKFQNLLLVTEQETTVDGILVVSEQSKIVNYNKRFLDIWGVPQEIMDSRADDRLLRYVQEQVIDPEKFTARITHLYRHQEEKSAEEIFLKDGRVFDRYSASMIGADGTYFGRVWYFRDITEKKNTIAQLNNSLEEKNILLKELYHRTKNNMQVICSIMNLKIAHSNDASVKEIFAEIITKIQTMALVHQKLYESNNLSNINLNEFVTSITDIIVKNNETTQGKISIHHSIDSIPISIDTAMPLGLVLNELIINTAKYAFPGDRKGDIWIDVHGRDDTITVDYKDNGIGLPRGFDPAGTQTLGMKIVQNIAKMQLGGEITITGEKGFNCRIEIKKIRYRTLREP